MTKRGRKKNSANVCRKDDLGWAQGNILASRNPASFDPSWGPDKNMIYLFDKTVSETIIDGYLLGKKNSDNRMYFDGQLDIYKRRSACCSNFERLEWISNLCYVFFE